MMTKILRRMVTSDGRRPLTGPPDGMIPRIMSRAAAYRARLSLSSRFENIELAERVLSELCDEAGWPEADRGPILSSLREAIANAVRHGNKMDLRRRVGVEYELSEREVILRVSDEGEGFDPSAVPDPTAPENLLRPGGRGIFFMKQLMDRVTIEARPAGGMLVVMSRRLNTEKAGGTLHEE